MGMIRTIPRSMLCIDHGEQPVARMVAHPPTDTKHPGPIKPECFCVDIKLVCGCHRWHGCEKARINSYLEMEVTVNPRDEVRRNWPKPGESHDQS